MKAETKKLLITLINGVILIGNLLISYLSGDSAVPSAVSVLLTGVAIV